MTNYIFFAVAAIILIAFGAIIFKLAKGKQDLLLHQKLDSLREDFTKNILQSQDSLLTSQRAVSEGLNKLYEKIGGLDKESNQILQLTRSFHDILKPTKARGILGESILSNLLRDVLPKEAVIAQYGFKDGKKVDFVIKLPSGIVPVDAKFSVESFRNYIGASEPEQERQRRQCIDSVKKRITETSSYIYPDEGTSDFALMYVPSEAVYYFIITETQLLEFAHQKKVFIVGPNTLYAYLKTIIIGFEAMKIEKRARQIYNDLRRLEKDLLVFVREYGILGSHIRSAAAKYEDVSRKIDTISFKLSAIGGQGEDDQGESDPACQEAQN